jgi:adenylate cyclase
LLGLLRRNPEAVATYSQAAADIASQYDLPGNWAALGEETGFFRGWAKRSEAAEESRLAEMRRSLAILRERGQVWLLPRFEAALAEAEASAGETDAGLRRLDDALAELERTEQRWYEAEMQLSSPIGGIGRSRGGQPGSKVSMMIMRPPQQGRAFHSLCS